MFYNKEKYHLAYSRTRCCYHEGKIQNFLRQSFAFETIPELSGALVWRLTIEYMRLR